MIYTSEMASILIKDVPLALHERLREAAARDHRSVNKEIIALLEVALDRSASVLPPPLQAGFRLNSDWLERAVAEGRE
jgi:plasmid stability protein